MTPDHPCTPVALLDIADLLGVQPRTPSKWRQRGLLPEPRWTVGGDPAWCWEHDIVPWSQRQRRPRQPIAEET